MLSALRTVSKGGADWEKQMAVDSQRTSAGPSLSDEWDLWVDELSSTTWTVEIGQHRRVDHRRPNDTRANQRLS
jgi:hypothetical protein